MSLRQRFVEQFNRGRQGDSRELEQLIAEEPGVVRHLLGMTYHPESGDRAIAIWGMGMAARYHPKLVQEIIRRLIWAMNDESGTNALTAPEVLREVAREKPELLLPFVPDLSRLAGDPALHPGLQATLRLISKAFPGEVGERMGRALSRGISGRRCR